MGLLYATISPETSLAHMNDFKQALKPAPRSLMDWVKHEWSKGYMLVAFIGLLILFFILMGLIAITSGALQVIVSFVFVFYGLFVAVAVLSDGMRVYEYMSNEAVWGNVTERGEKITIQVQANGEAYNFKVTPYKGEAGKGGLYEAALENGYVPCLFPKGQLEKVRIMSENEFALIAETND